MQAVWQHSGIEGRVWLPSIRNISKNGGSFSQGEPLEAGGDIPQLDTERDWYWTPAVATGDSRKLSSYPAQRVLWVDCDDGYNEEALDKLRPSIIWETSPGHKQAIWLLTDYLNPSEFHKNGLAGLITQAVGADKSGVDIGQLLRVPGSWHHKREPFEGKILRFSKSKVSRGQLLTRVAKVLGFSAGLASDLGADDPYGDRSKQLWKIERSAVELGLPKELTFKLIKACKWNKWEDDTALLTELDKAYSQGVPEPAVEVVEEDEGEEPQPWDMESVQDFGHILSKPLSWVVPDMIPEAGCGLLVAPPKVGKTRVSIELMLGLATGTNPLGVRVRKPQPVGFFSLEDGEYLFSSRLNSSLNTNEGRYKFHWNGYINTELEWCPSATMPLLTNFDQIDLSDDEDKQRLALTIQHYGLRLVIIDTLSMAIGKSDVSNSKDMYAILKDIKTIAKATKCAIMFIHHTRKRVFDKGESIQERVLGSTALHAWSDFILSLAPPEEDSDLLRLAVQTKMGYENYYITQSLKIAKPDELDIQE